MMAEAPKQNASDSTRKRGRPTLELSDEVNARIHRAALRHFLTEGAERASIQRIARDAGVSRQLIYQKHGDKRRLFESAIAMREPAFFAGAQIPDPAGPTPPFQALLTLAQHMTAYLLTPDRIELAQLMYGGLHRFPEIAAIERDARERAQTGVARFLDAVLRQEGVEGVDVEAAARDFRSLVNGLTLPVILGLEAPPQDRDRERIVAEMVSRFVRGLGLDPDRLQAAGSSHGKPPRRQTDTPTR